ncbi:sulfite oxidase-like oxidoreductase [Truepera radiovictrix]|uniref:Oxidoreductase molybdopterin binding protein n=1 Tax=Truepera radiovictrix (strain DSM 17093 / CIP 108686 / LMG 22925 / RQ-24) TaxID=649638 RepID=D7CUA3_TRURR|nr:sulfite oxidase-like oxidoreductase [Truepera radiovictrix]ADI14001.1 oxidoreductase molybdopterin binding protein [Truepera radiovictrix DSM 17093]WMT57439.1 sulfite oxidase-like oxidoreductase [Truepera radiovictrix]
MLGKIFHKAPASSNVPPGQSVTERFPVMTYGPTPRVSEATFELRIFGLAEETTLSWEALLALPQTRITRDFHCVTHWSKLGVSWTGVLTTELIRHLAVHPEATHVMLHCYGGYTTNLALEDFLADGCLIAHKLEGQPIPVDHGGPVRAVIPHLYAWKSAKWLSGIEFMRGDRPGFWERNGYHRRGDPFREERYS